MLSPRQFSAITGIVVFGIGMLFLLLPITTTAFGVDVRCGSAVFPSDNGRAFDENVEAYNYIEREYTSIYFTPTYIAQTDFEALCAGEISNRQFWAIPLAGVGAFAVAGAGLIRSRRASVDQPQPIQKD